MSIKKIKTVSFSLVELSIASIIILAVASFSSCNFSTESTNYNTSTEIEPNGIIDPDDSLQISYTLERVENRPAHCIIYVRLQKKVSKARLQLLSDEIKYDQKCTSDKIRIFYMLTETKTGNGAWVRVEYSPSFSLQYLGLGLEEENKATAQTSKFRTIGAWIDNNSGQPGIAQRIRYDSKGKLILEYYEISNPDREALVNSELKKMIKEGKTKFKVLESETDDYYVLQPNGDLACYDNQGLIMTLKKLQ